MSYRFTGIIDRCLLSGSEFTRRLRAVRPEQWTGPTPCAEWDVQRLVNHMTRGNLNYVALLDGGSVAGSSGSGTWMPCTEIPWARTSGRSGSVPRRSAGQVRWHRSWTTLSAR
ncbi:maleylpyruvate isomerase N-terminal domain-containing protein [Streptomyces sp. NPDC048241]|uniref:maleylpyruvate isomerase N-terminal domain-containing protein n=1 Tax=Streptomyces sp. NPDC048241 TaxID=3365521 RepID=UPI0037187529